MRKKQVALRTLSDHNRPQDEPKERRRPKKRGPLPGAPASSAKGRAYEGFLELARTDGLGGTVASWGADLRSGSEMVAYSAAVWLSAALEPL
jgi:hypothetical protein